MLELVQIVGALLRRRRKVPDPSAEASFDHGDLTAEEMAAAPEVSYEDEYGRRVASSEFDDEEVE